MVALSRSDSASISPPLDQALPLFLTHPALSDMDNQCWSWQEVGQQLRIEVVFFNRDPQVLFDFLYQGFLCLPEFKGLRPHFSGPKHETHHRPS